jgi:4-amino-4-deoxy-L-arabinose transferase-like glycosyltransferase
MDSLLVKNQNGRRSKAFWIFIAFCLGSYLLGMQIPLFDDDPAHHANIGLRMFLTGDYLNLIDHGKPYLDKPHLLFWLSALSFKVFGVLDWAYRLPSLLTSILGCWATYKIGTLLFDRRTGITAVLLLLVAFAFSLAHNDVRMDGMLASFMIFSFWQLVEFEITERWKNLFLASLGLALAFMTKGMIGPSVPLIAYFFLLIQRKSWKRLVDWRIYLVVPLFLLFSMPTLYAYYVQFDLHPELEIRGKTGHSGVKFILWNQNFERFNGDNFGSSGKNDPYFFFHSILWSLLPWSFLFYLALVRNASECLKKSSRENWSIAATILFLLSIYSFSGFKLPHYLLTLAPFMALISGRWLPDIGRFDWVIRIQYFLLGLILILVIVCNVYFFPTVWVFLPFAMLVFAFWDSKNLAPDFKFLMRILLVGGFTNLMMQGNFYLKLMNYQSGSVLGKNEQVRKLDQEKVFLYESSSPSFHFNNGYLHPDIILEDLLKKLDEGQIVYIFTGNDGICKLKDFEGVHVDIIAESPDFPVEKLKFKFINPKTRHQTIKRDVVAAVYKSPRK